ESALAGLHERVHPRLDLGLLEVVLAAHVHELPLPPDQLKEELNLPLRRPPLELPRLHRPSARTRVLYPVQSRREPPHVLQGGSAREWGPTLRLRRASEVCPCVYRARYPSELVRSQHGSCEKSRTCRPSRSSKGRCVPPQAVCLNGSTRV